MSGASPGASTIVSDHLYNSWLEECPEKGQESLTRQ